MNARAVAMTCPECGAPAELRSVLTDQGFLVARAALMAHLEDEHGLEPDEAAEVVESLKWTAAAGQNDDLN